jgi:hypothetical protein
MARPKSSTQKPDKEKEGLTGNSNGHASAEEMGKKDLLILQQDWLKALNEIQMRMQRRCNQAQAAFVHTLYEAQLTSDKSQHEAYRDYVLSVQDVAGRQDALQSSCDAEERYFKDFESAKEKVMKGVEETERSMRDALEETIDEANKDWDQTCAEYLKQIQDRFCRLDTKTVRPEIIALLGQSLLWASNHLRAPAMDR